MIKQCIIDTLLFNNPRLNDYYRVGPVQEAAIKELILSTFEYVLESAIDAVEYSYDIREKLEEEYLENTNML